MPRQMVPHDGNSAVAHVAHATNEVIAIYPITPSSNMGEIADDKSASGEKNIWGSVPTVVELQSEGGASGAVHGALTAGALSTTFTASQGLLLMIPNMYKIAGELTATVFHVSARSLACQALSIFGDHSDVMAVRQTGWALLSSNNVQEAMDLALISHAATLEARVPFVHFFDGFRVSHEIQKIEELTFDDMRAMIDQDLVRKHRERGLSPDRPMMRGTAQNPDVYFQGRETVNKYYLACPSIVQKHMDKFAKMAGRQYHLFEYSGAADAEDIIIVMGSGADTVEETVEHLNKAGEKLGVVKVRLYRPFDVKAFAAALPKTVKRIAVLDRTKEPGSIGEPLYEDVRTAIGECMEHGWVSLKQWPKVIGGRYGLGSAEFTPAMAKAVFSNLKSKEPKNHFTVGIIDDVTQSSLDFDPEYTFEDNSVYRAMFYGLGADGTVSANKNTMKIIADETDNYSQGYFVYDSKKAGAITVSHLRFGKNLIKRPYLISSAHFLACHNWSFLEKYDMLKNVMKGGTFLLNSPYDAAGAWNNLPKKVQKQIIDKKLKFYIIDGVKIAEDIGLGGRINTIMQTAFFKISGVMDVNQAISSMKDAIKKTYGKKGDKIVAMNIASIDKALEGIQEVKVPASFEGKVAEFRNVPDNAPEFVKNVTATLMKGEGDTIKVSQMPEDGTWPTGTTMFEKRNIAINVPEWDGNVCIQCGRCSMACPHSVIRVKMYGQEALKGAPASFKSAPVKEKGKESYRFTLQVSAEDCTGCTACYEFCPVKDKGALKMVPRLSIIEREKENYNFFNTIPDTDASIFQRNSVRGMQFVRPLFEFSGACAGCGETPNIKLLTQLFGDRLVIGNATGCTSIYGGNLPTTPYAKRADGRGPAWSNSLFEDAAEFAFGMRLTADKFTEYAKELLTKIQSTPCGEKMKALISEILSADQSTQEGIEKQREKVARLKEHAGKCGDEACRELISVADYLVKKSIWGLGGDGWAYDIGYGGLDHVLASGKKVNLLVLDTEVYSNTGGQASKSTPRGAVAKFASAGKTVAKKDLGMIYITYGYVYVARIAIGADPNQALKAFMEADAYSGPSIIIAYSHCIAHGIDMPRGNDQQKKAVASGYWPLYRYNPDLAKQGKNPLQMDSKDPSIPLTDYIGNENRYNVLKKINPKAAEELGKAAQADVNKRFNLYKQLAAIDYSKM